MTVNLKAKIYTDEDAARRHLERIQWPNGPICPHCGVVDQATLLQGKSTRPGVYKCRACEKPFSVTVGTVFEDSKVPLTKWLLATQLLTSSKKGISAHQMHRMLGVTYKTAWFMAHRIREAMKPAEGSAPLGGEGQTVEADETYFGKPAVMQKQRKSGRPFTRGSKTGRGTANKRGVLALVERAGKVRSFHVREMTKANVENIVAENVSSDSRFLTDESRLYLGSEDRFAEHATVKHSRGEYVRDDIYTNTVEGYFSVFKRGMVGTYQHCGEQHLHRYLSEFDFRYSNRTAMGVDDATRADIALGGIGGKRLTYRRTVQA